MSDVTTDQPPILGVARKWWVVATITPSLTLMGLNATILDIPSLLIVPELDSDRYRIQWATGASFLGAILGMSMLRWLRDRFGLKNIYLAAMLLFALSSVACGLARVMPAFALARFFQGLGDGLVITNVLALLWREFPRSKDRAMAFYGMGIYFGKAIAPPLGGFLCDYPDWRWIFYINALVGAATFILSWWILLPDKPIETEPQPFDFPGLWLLIIWTIAVLICLFRGQKWGWTTSPPWNVAALIFVISFILWFWREYTSDHPLVDLSLLRHRTFHLSVIIKGLYMINLGAVLTLLVEYMITTRGYPRTTTGLVMLPAGLAMGAALIFSALVGMDWNRKRRLVIGMVFLTVGTWLLSGVDLYTDKWRLSAEHIIWGIGAGLALPPMLVLALEGLPQALVVSSATIKNLNRELPSTFGSLLIGTLLVRRTDANFDYLRQDIVHNRAVAENVKAGLEVYLTTKGSSGPAPAEQAAHVLSTYIQSDAAAYAAQTGFQYLAILTALGVVLALFVHSPHDEPETQASS